MTSAATVDAELVEQFRADGWIVLPDVLTADEVRTARAALTDAVAACETQGLPVRLDDLDPGGRNIRVYDLVAHGRVFAALAEHPAILPWVEALLGPDVILSNFTAE